MFKNNSAKPEYMITYLCSACGNDFAITEKDKLKCFYCESEVNFREVKREKITPAVMATRLKLVVDRMMDNLKQAQASSPDNIEEMEMLQVLAKAKKFQEGIHSLELKENEKINKENER